MSLSEQWWDTPEFRLGTMLRRLHDAGVDFVVVGGVAVIVQGSPRFTKDLDICYASTKENLDRLGAVLIEMGAKLRGVDDDLPFVPDGRSLAQTQILTLLSPDGAIDLLVDPDGSPGYETLRRNAREIDADGFTIKVASIDDLIAMKRAAGRPQDLVDIEALEIVRERS